ncbi:hypothetical protein [Synechococcus sp. WH 8016]|uniref:hypothetical protein n=1 Tax=Synechococcus sp. WH 8016 TaxID=166318 RepID=UPI00022DA185|nr:hypothetical protein [Synechococcus sp. WH 8016]EHA64071.1 hypothetical protein Syn8016DRAFT_1113 [Synechococcus sp. WH 8016]
MKLSTDELKQVINKFGLAFSGIDAIDWFISKTKRIGHKRWTLFLNLLRQINFFGGITLIASENEMNWWNKSKTLQWHKDDADVVGLYRSQDHWIELIVSRMTSWSRMEAVLRHEFVHLLQDVTFDGSRNDVQAWAKADNLIRPYGKRAAKFDEAVEAEAYWLMIRPGEVKREADKIINQPDRWSNWFCSIHY